MQRLKGDTGRLAGTYLAIIMGLTLVFSGIIFSISSSQFDRPLPRGPIGQFRDIQNEDLQELFDRRADEARAELMASLIFLNLAVLIGGGMFSYFLARKSLEPIEAAMESQARFVSDASHELRTPIASLQVTNEVALRKKKLSLADAKELIGHNLAETIKLRTLAESLLVLAKVDGTDTSRQKVDIDELAASVVTSFAPLAKEKSIEIVRDVPNIVLAINESTVSQVLRILLDNAIKYGPPSSRITLSYADTSTAHQFAVHDDGPGIPVDQQRRIFERFYRIDESRSSMHTQGTGLGLAIAKAAAERQGYDLAITAGEHEGNTFVLNIPKGGR